MLKKIVKDKLAVQIYQTRAEAGKDAARDGANAIRELLAKQEWVNIIFAAAPSQNDTLAALFEEPGIDWTRCRAFHMDEYVGFPKEKEQSFGYYLYEHVFGKLPFGEVHYVNGANPNPEAECKRYGDLLTKYPTDVVFLGIGENAHIAFNDPWVADFNDPQKVKLVPLDETCRNQQVHDGCFATLADVPTHAFTLTIPSLTAAKVMICTVPAATKANAVYSTVNAEISADVPATVMRLHNNAVMYCDAESGAQLL
ncbi:MAG: glucosamine-6-phosphate deaminase [Clostridia bacterium]|nr:glucosamine-6-phosphate deaminase [Clostridia bacterium]